MIAASLPSDSGDAALKLLLQQGANVNVNSNSGQVSPPFSPEIFFGTSQEQCKI